MKTNYVLIDYENVQPDSFAALEREHFRVLVFVGAHQTKVAFETAAALQRLGPSASYVKISGSGVNALDFHVAFYVGELAAKDPDGYFHIVSKDTGFDPLVKHLKERKLRVSRVREIGDIPLVKADGASSTVERLEVVVADLKKRGGARPRTLKTLSGTIHALFGRRLDEKEISSLVAALEAKGYLAVSGTKVSYAFPT